jgi:hypothetical protein
MHRKLSAVFSTREREPEKVQLSKLALRGDNVRLIRDRTAIACAVTGSVSITSPRGNQGAAVEHRTAIASSVRAMRDQGLSTQGNGPET